MSRALPHDPDCDDLVEQVTDYLEGALPIEARTAFELHLAYCLGCATFLRQFGAQIEAARRLAIPALPADDVKARLVALFRESRR